MLRQIGSWTSSFFSFASHKENPVKPEPNPSQQEPFSKQLKDIGYDENKIPLYFICPISCELMEDPVYVNQLQTNTFDKQWLEKSRENSPHFDPFKTRIDSVEENTERKNQIKDFVSLLKNIHKHETNLLKNECFLSSTADLSDIEQLRLTRLKIHLLIATEVFIKFVTNIINLEDKHREIREKEREIDLICHDMILWVSKFNEDLKGSEQLILFFKNIYSYQKQIKDYESSLLNITSLGKTVYNENDTLLHEIEQFIGEEKESIHFEIVRTKIKLASELEFCVNHVKSFYPNADRQEIEEIYKDEIESANTLKLKLAKMKHVYPQLFLNPHLNFFGKSLSKLPIKKATPLQLYKFSPEME